MSAIYYRFEVNDKQMNRFLLTAAALTASVIATAGAADAAIVGKIWSNTGGIDASTTPANNSSLPSANFSVGQINYNSSVTGYTPALFLNNPIFTNLTNGFDPNGTLDNTFILITGQTFLNAGDNSFNVPHDDGVVLSVNGTNYINQPGPTSAVNSPFTVNVASAGLYDFRLQYSEVQGAPAVLGFSVNSAPVTGTPEPASFALMGSALTAGIVLVRRRRKTQAGL